MGSNPTLSATKPERDPLTARAVAAVVLAALLLGACTGSNTHPRDFVDVPGLGPTRVDVPRPTTPGAEACALALSSDESMTERATALRKIGFFAASVDLPDAALGVEVEAALGEAWGEQLAPDDPLLELLAAAEDTARVWWRDLEADVADGNGVYAATLEEWAAISDGAFAPSAVEEAWASDEGPVTIDFELDGTRLRLEPAYAEDWVDARIATPINELIAASGRRFEFVKAFDQTAFVMALTVAERDALEARGWCF